jgi:hypothetical protein
VTGTTRYHKKYTPLLRIWNDLGFVCRLAYWLSWQVYAVCSHLLTLVPCSWIFLPRRWKRYVLTKRRFTQDLHGATSQKTAFFILYFILRRCQYLSWYSVQC